MPTDRDFLAAVIADPDTDGPRLIYADWLEDRGDESRAEFIRLQCALARLPAADREHHPDAAREREHWHRHRDDWTRPLDVLLMPGAPAGWLAPIRSAAAALAAWPIPTGLAEVARLISGDRWCFRRGFAEELRARSREFLRAAESIAQATPLRSVTLNLSDAGALAAVADCPQLAGLTCVRLFNEPNGAGQIEPLLSSPHAARLRRLGLHQFWLSPQELERLAASPLLTRLEELEISIAGGDAGSRRRLLSAAAATPSLNRLSLQRFWPESEAPDVAADWPGSPHLVELDLAWNPLGDCDLTGLLDRTPALAALELEGCGLGELAVRSLARSTRLRQLRSLDLSGNRLTDSLALELAVSPNLLAGTRLHLRNVELHPSVQAALRHRFGDQIRL